MSAEEIAQRRRAGESFWVQKRPVPEDLRAEIAAETRAWLEDLPGHVEALHGLYAGHDAFDVIAGLLTLQADHHGRRPAERSPFLDSLIGGETAALVLLTRAHRAPTGAAEMTLREAVVASIPHLQALTDRTGAALAELGASAEPDPLAVMQDRFIRHYLFVPINETEAQAREWVGDLFDSETIRTWLVEHVGFTVESAGRLVTSAYELMIGAYASAEIPPEPGIGEMFAFSAAELAAGAGVGEAAAEAFCSVLSQGFGQPELEWPVLPTALRHRPLLHDGRGSYLSATPALLLRSLRYVLAAQLNPAIPTGDGDARVYQDYLDRRARLLERRALSAFNGLLGADYHWSNLHFRLTGAQDLEGEIDGLLVLDEVAIVIQAKSAPTRIDAVAGDRARFVAVLRAILTESMRQHDDARRALAAGRDAVRFWQMRDGTRTAVEVPELDVSRLLPVTVTLEDLSGCAPALWELRDAGLATDGPLPWVVAVTPLEVMLGLLPFAAQLVQFLRRRTILNETRNLEVVDEIDIFLEFLHDQLAIVFSPPAEDGSELVLMPPERFHALDEWLRAQRDGTRGVAPPRQHLPRGLRRLLARLERDRPEGWLESAIAALGGTSESRAQLAKTANWFLDGKRTALQGVSYDDPREGRVGVVFVNVTPQTALGTEQERTVLTQARRDKIDVLYAVGVPLAPADPLMMVWAGPVPGRG